MSPTIVMPPSTSSEPTFGHACWVLCCSNESPLLVNEAPEAGGGEPFGEGEEPSGARSGVASPQVLGEPHVSWANEPGAVHAVELTAVAMPFAGSSAKDPRPGPT